MTKTIKHSVIAFVLFAVLAVCMSINAGNANAATLSTGFTNGGSNTTNIAGQYYWLTGEGIFYNTEDNKDTAEIIIPLTRDSSNLAYYATDGKVTYIVYSPKWTNETYRLMKFDPATKEVSLIKESDKSMNIVNIYGTKVCVKEGTGSLVFIDNDEVCKTMEYGYALPVQKNTRYVVHCDSNGNLKSLDMSTGKTRTIVKNSSFDYYKDGITLTSTKIYYSKKYSATKRTAYSTSYPSGSTAKKLTTVTVGNGGVDKVTSKYVYYWKYNSSYAKVGYRKTISSGKITKYSDFSKYQNLAK